MGIVKFHGKALRLNGFTDGLVVPTGKFRESGIDLRDTAFSGSVKATKSHATKIGRMHIESKSNPLNVLRGAFTIDAYIIPDYGGIIIDKPGAFRLSYGNPFSTGKIVFDVYAEERIYSVSSSFDAPVKTQSNSGVYSSSSNAHRPQELTLGEQGLVLVTAQYTQEEIKIFVNAELVAKYNLGGESSFLRDSTSDIWIGGQGGEFRGIIESVRISHGINTPLLEPLTKTEKTVGMWDFEDEIDIPEVYFFDHGRPGTPMQGRDGPDTHDGLVDIPMVGIGYDFNTTYFKIRDYPDNPANADDRYTALEKLAALTQGIELEEVKNQTWSASSLDLTNDNYLTNVKSTVLNAVINHSGTSPITGIITPPDTKKIRFSDNNVLSTSSTSTLNPSVNRIERIRITSLDFANNRIYCTSVHLANDAANGTIDNLPETQGHVFAHTDNTPVWFTMGNADLLIDSGNEEVSGSVTNQRTRAKDTFTIAQYIQGQRFGDKSGYANDAFFFSSKSRSTASTNANTLYSPSTTYGYMGAVTSYSVVEGDFYLKMLPAPDEQKVKQTVQGIANTFTYINEDVRIQSLISENERVKVTEPVFHGELLNVINKSKTVAGVDSAGSSSNVLNRIVTETGVGFYQTNISQNIYSSTKDEIVAIAVADPKPFMLKGLDTEHTAEFSGGVPTNDSYIRHLTPEKKTRIAVIDSPSLMVSGGGPSKVLVYYDAIDLTGEIVAGTSLASAGVQAKFRADHITGNASYLVVKKTIPSGSAVFNSRTVSDWLRRPYSGNETDATAIELTITAPGGLVSLPTTNFAGKPSSHVLKSNPTGDITPSPFINIEDTVYSLGTGIRGYGRPKAVPSTNTPDSTSNSDYHLLYITGSSNSSKVDYKTTQLTPSSFRRSNLAGYDVIDNELTGSENLVLIHPSSRERYALLDDVSAASKSSLDPSVATLEKVLMRGRIEEIMPNIGEKADITLKGRSMLMDVLDFRSERNFNLAEGSPVKEIGDLGTPTVSMTLGGLGQGGIDLQPVYTEHPYLKGWKDRIVGTGNASVRNDKQASTYYASTRALTEIPLFPSMFYDVESILDVNNEARTPLPSSNRFLMDIDCTMATNRPEMRENESRFAVDWGQRSPVASIEVTDQMHSWITHEQTAKRWLIRCQRPSVQAVVATTAYNAGTGVLTVDDASAFLKTNGERGLAANCADVFYVTIGEGVLNDGYGFVAKAAYTSGTTLTLTPANTWNPLDTATTYLAQNANLSNIDLGMTVTLGGYIVIGGADEASESPIIYDYTDSSISNQSFSDFGATLASDLATAIRNLMGLNANAVHADPNNDKRYYILDGPNMEAFEWDILEANESANDRNALHPVICRTNALALKGKKSDGSSLDYVRPLNIDFSDVAVKVEDFNACVNEVVRRINMAGHPQAKNSAGGSAFDPPSLFPLDATNNDTGSHMGHVRAFIGTNTESRDGEAGISIVIHSSVPGASGRNFNVRLSNKTPYTYKPSQVIGYGGLLATNSRLYRPNSFAAPMPIGEDGETFVPITTFQGAPSGSTLNSANNLRAYNGLGNSFIVTTVASVTGETLAGAAISAGTIKMTNPEHSNSFFDSPPATITHLAVSTTCEDYLKRISQTPNSTSKGILRVNGMTATYESISQQKLRTGTGYEDIGTNCFFIQNITPQSHSMTDFFSTFFDTNDSSPINGIEVELIYPGVDSEGIVYFGGGHTGVTFDISDGTANDYSDDYPHHLSKGPTGFSGFQNLHEVTTASAVLDFTNIKNEDTINENTTQGFHHKLRVNSDGELDNNCLLYLRFNNTLSNSVGHNQVAIVDEALYGSKVRASAGFEITTVADNYSSGNALNVTNHTPFAIGSGTRKAIIGSDSFTFTGASSGVGSGTGALTGISSLSAVSAGAEIRLAKNITATNITFSRNTDGPASAYDNTDGSFEFKGFNSVATHHYDISSTTSNSEYGPMKSFDTTKDFSISCWFKCTDGAHANNGEISSGPLVTGNDVNGKVWGLFLMGDRESGNQYQRVRFAFMYHNGTNWTIKRNTVTGTGATVLIRDNAWNNVIVTKTGTDTVKIFLGSHSGIYFKSGETNVTSLTNLFSGSVDSVTRSAVSTTTSTNQAGVLPHHYGASPAASTCFIGLSTIKKLETLGFMSDSFKCGTNNGEDSLGATATTGVENYTSNQIVWLFNTRLSEVAIFNHALVASERTELFDSVEVW
tara:strand:+ start:393 stop:7007 length:6615 start_codon:yes stop_codon:yes gene_type:complete